MKKLALFIPILLFIYSCGDSTESETEETSEVVEIDSSSAPQEEPEPIINSITIEENTVGIFKIGEQVPERLPEELSMRQFIEEVEVNGKTIEQTHNVIFNALEDVVELFMDQGTGEHHTDMLIEEMWVLSNYYETSEQIHVGSTIHDFEGAYPNIKGWYAPDIDKFFVDTEDLLGAQFIVDDKSVDRAKPNGNTVVPVAISAFDQQAEIVKIRLY